MNIEPSTCETSSNLWNRFVCWLHGVVEPLCSKKLNGEFKQSNKLGIGSWKLLSYGTDCGCCHGFRVLFLGLVWMLVGRYTPPLVGNTLFLLLIIIVYAIGHRFTLTSQDSK